MESQTDRRTFLKQTALASAAAALTLAGSQTDAAGASPAVADPAGGGKIGNLQISRILLGGNLLTHYTHSRDLRYVYNLAKHYNTQKKIFQTLATAEANGINTLVIHTAPNVLEMLQQYRQKHEGKIQSIVCSTAPIDDPAKYGQSLKQMVDAGVDSIYIWGVQADAMVAQGKVSAIAKAVELGKALKVPVGLAAHELRTIQECQKAKIDADFYLKTLHHHNYPSAKLNHDSMWCAQPQETIEFMKTVNKPWIAYKVMAAGAIPPEDAFRYAITHGADFVVAGMFDFEIAEDVQIARRAMSSLSGRTRPWFG